MSFRLSWFFLSSCGSKCRDVSKQRNRQVVSVPLRSDQSGPVHQGLCQQVLSAVQSLARGGAVMSRDTWETLLHFLLHINQVLLVPPSAAGGRDSFPLHPHLLTCLSSPHLCVLCAGSVSPQLSHLSVAAFFEVWVLSCARCFPPQWLWKMCRQMLSSWRHQEVVDQWGRVIAALTSR